MKPQIRVAAVLLSLAISTLASRALAQPFGSWMTSTTTTTGKWIEVGSTPDLNPTDALTFEAWVNNTLPTPPGQTCRSLLGKNYQTSYWFGICGNQLRSYLKGSSSLSDGGTVPTANGRTSP
jgi:hypothetical protein